MRTALRLLTAAFAALFCVQQAAAQSVEETKDFQLVQSIGSRKAYEVFLRAYPNGHYTDIVRKQLQEMGPPGEISPRDPRLEPNWGDGIFIDRLLQKQR